MQQQWNDIDHYIESKLIPEDANLKFALNNTSAQGFPDHLAVAPNQGMLLQMLIQMNKCKRVLELGTFAAYSTLWLARVLPEDGYLMTIEGRDNHAAAQQNIDQANLAVPIELKVGRAAEILAAIDAKTFEPFDFIFIDADKQSYPEYLELSLNLSHSGTVIVLDNVIRAAHLSMPKTVQVSKVSALLLNSCRIIRDFCRLQRFKLWVRKDMMVSQSRLSNSDQKTDLNIFCI